MLRSNYYDIDGKEFQLSCCNFDACGSSPGDDDDDDDDDTRSCKKLEKDCLKKNDKDDACVTYFQKTCGDDCQSNNNLSCKTVGKMYLEGT